MLLNSVAACAAATTKNRAACLNLELGEPAMVWRRTEYSKRQHAIQEAYFTAMHLRKSRVKPQFMKARAEQFMNARNKWNTARKVIKQGGCVRVSSRAVANLREGNAMCASLRKEIGREGSA